MSVEFVRPEVTAKKAAWQLVRDAVAGSEAVKGGKYIIPVNPSDKSAENTERNEQRVKRAVYFNATGRTLPALLGIAFSKWPEIKLPAGLDLVKQDASGDGVSLINQAQVAVAETLQTGRAGLFVDFPSGARGRPVIELEREGIRPTIQIYPAEQIINWRTEKIGARNMLTLVVLREGYEVWGEFELESKTQYRVLRLLNGRYYQQTWRANRSGEWAISSAIMPTDGASRPLNEIPFQFIGSTNNDAMPDAPPLYDLADLNIAHFRNSADHEESLFFAGQAQVWLTGDNISEEQIALMQREGMYVGSRSIGIAPGGVELIQASAVSGLSEEMKHKVELMGQLGARLVAPGTVARTAQESSSDDKTSNSVLSIVCDNVSEAYRKALYWVARFAHIATTPDTLDFTISTEFSGIQFDAQQMAQALSAVQSGKLPESDFWVYCRAVGLIRADKLDEEIREEIAEQGPALGEMGAVDDIGAGGA